MEWWQILYIIGVPAGFAFGVCWMIRWGFQKSVSELRGDEWFGVVLVGCITAVSWPAPLAGGLMYGLARMIAKTASKYNILEE